MTPLADASSGGFSSKLLHVCISECSHTLDLFFQQGADFTMAIANHDYLNSTGGNAKAVTSTIHSVEVARPGFYRAPYVVFTSIS